jgi:uncharacterized protein (TIGR00251 family)
MSSTPRKFQLHHGTTGSAIAVRVTTRMTRNEIIEILEDGTVKIRITSAPVDGKANDMLIDYLAKVLDVSPGKVQIIAGQTSKNKLISILELDTDEVNKRILRHINKNI